MRFSICVLALLPYSLCSPAHADQREDRPNVIVILADDFGYGSLGCYGAPPELKTPHLDRLAHEGRRFTQAYAPGSVCSPTRYGLMTGRYFWRTSVKDGGVLPGNAPLHIETDRLTLASLCKAQGYRTAAFGKWHLGMGTEKTTDWSGDLRPDRSRSALTTSSAWAPTPGPAPTASSRTTPFSAGCPASPSSSREPAANRTPPPASRSRGGRQRSCGRSPNTSWHG